MTISWLSLFWLFFFYSFIGWCIEVCSAAVQHRKFVNRGFVAGPLCPIYGFGAMLFEIFLPELTEYPFFLFLGGFVLSSLLEYSTGMFFEKVYNEDIAFSVIRGGDKDITHNLENIIYNELIFMGYELFLYDNNGKEIDFLAIKGGKEYLIQVAYSVAENKAREREIGAFASLDNSRAKVLITNDEIDFFTSTVKHIKLKDFLLMDEL